MSRAKSNVAFNPVLRTIKERRSIRSYKPEPVPRKYIEKIIDAGNWAPSAGNLQPWRFVVIEDEKIRGELSSTVNPNWRRVMEQLMKKDPERYGMHREYMNVEDPVFYSAPVIIFVIGFSGVNCALACENMMLAAHSFGLGSCYIGWGALVMGDPKIVDLLGLDDKEKIYGPITVGYPLYYPEAPNKDDPQVKWV
jgi:nitroreductase